MANFGEDTKANPVFDFSIVVRKNLVKNLIFRSLSGRILSKNHYYLFVCGPGKRKDEPLGACDRTSLLPSHGGRSLVIDDAPEVDGQFVALLGLIGS